MNNTGRSLRTLLALVMVGLLTLATALPAHAADSPPLTEAMQKELATWICEHEVGRDARKCKECIALWKQKHQPDASTNTSGTPDVPTLVAADPVAASTVTEPVPAAVKQKAADTPAAGQPATTQADTKTDPADTKTETKVEAKTESTENLTPVPPLVESPPVVPPVQGQPQPPQPPSLEGNGNGAPQPLPAGSEGNQPAPGQTYALEVTGLAATPAEPVVGALVTLSVSLDGIQSDSAPQGVVVFAVGGETLYAQVHGRSASVTWKPSAEGAYSVSAVYQPATQDAYVAGDALHQPVTVAAAPADDGAQQQGQTGEPAAQDASTLKQSLELEITTLAAPAKGDIAQATITATGSYVYNNTAITPAVSVILGGMTLKPGQDYFIKDLQNNTNAGTASFTVQGINGYGGVKDSTFIIQKANAANAWNVQLEKSSFERTGNKIEPRVTAVTGINGEAIPDTLYDVAYPGAGIEAGTYSVTVTAKATATNYQGTATAAFTITAAATKQDLTQANTTVVWQTPNYMDGATPVYVKTTDIIEPTATVQLTVDGAPAVTLTPGVDYAISYVQVAALAGTTPGSYTATISGAGNYQGTLPAYSYKVVDRQTQGLQVVASPASYAYTGMPIEPANVSVTSGGRPLAASQYTLDYSDNTQAGVVTVTATGQAEYAGQTGTGSFTITQKPVQMSLEVTAGNGELFITAYIAGSVNLQNSVTFSVTVDGNQYSRSTTVDVYGNATVSVPASSTGYYQIFATHPGDRNHTSSQATRSSGTRVPYISVSVTDTGLGGGYPTINVTVSGGWYGVVPTGDVILRVDGGEIARVRLDRFGRASHTLYNAGQWNQHQMVTAEYLGDGYYAPITSKAVPLWSVSKLIPYINLKTSVGTGSRPTTLTATVTGTHWYDHPTGSVSFYNGEKYLGMTRLDRRGEAVFTWENVPNGTHTLYAVYNGDAMYRAGTATAKITKRASGSGSGGSGSGSSTIPQQTRAEADFLVYDDNGTVVRTVNTATTAMRAGGIMQIEAAGSGDFFGYGVTLSRLRQLTSNAGGYFDIVGPGYTLQLPYNLVTGLPNLSGYLQQKGLTEAATELRVNVRRISDSSLESSFLSSNAGSTIIAAYRVEIALYNASGMRLDYTPTQIDAPLLLVVPVDGATGFAMGYDEQARQFTTTAVEMGNGTAKVTIAKNAIYIVAK